MFDGRVIVAALCRDVDFISDRMTPLEEVMTVDLVTAPEGTTRAQALALLQKHKCSKLPIINDKGELVSVP